MRLANSVRKVCTDAVAGNINVGGAGKLQFYTGAMPATPDDAATGTLLAELPLSNPAFQNADSVGTAVGNTVTDDLDPLATGDVGYVRMVKGDSSVHSDLSVGLAGSGADVEMNTLSVILNIPVRVLAITLRKPM